VAMEESISRVDRFMLFDKNFESGYLSVELLVSLSLECFEFIERAGPV
jgi:hypothetical protein